MKKWIFAVLIASTSILLFISGTLVGYSTYDYRIHQKSDTKERPSRKPSRKLPPIVEIVISRQMQRMTSKVRTPTSPALAKAQRYRNMLER